MLLQSQTVSGEQREISFFTEDLLSDSSWRAAINLIMHKNESLKS